MLEFAKLKANEKWAKLQRPTTTTTTTQNKNVYGKEPI